MIPNHNSNPSRSIDQPVRAGLSLVEIMIALTMTLIVLVSMMSAFQYASAEMQNGRATLEMANRVRVAENLLRRDLANLTVEPRPYMDKAIPNGYFEYIEGPRRDLQFPFGVDADGDGVPVTLDPNDNDNNNPAPVDVPRFRANTVQNNRISYLGDADDILAMTVRSVAGQVFRGRIQGSTNPAESAYAEVVWWTQFNDSDDDAEVDYTESVTVYRRVLVINPNLPSPPTNVSYTDAMRWIRNSDVSVRLEQATAITFNIVPNSLQDLANRRNRFARFSTDVDNNNVIDSLPSIQQFPHFLNRGSLIETASSNGSDILLTDVASFDVKTYDPQALVFEVSGSLIGPCSPNYVVDAMASCTHTGVAGSPSEFAIDELPPNAPDGINDTAGRTGGFANLGYPDVALDPNANALATAAGNAGLGGGAGRFSQTTSPVGFMTSSGPVPKGVLNYQFNFHNSTGTDFEDLMDTAYDTWTPQYENDGINQDPSNDTTFALGVDGGSGGQTTNIDQGIDGIDNNTANGPDDFTERETIPPYMEPICGLKVTFRMVEKQTGQVRQSSVVQRYETQ